MHGLIHWLAGAFAHFLLGSLTVWVYVLTNRGGRARRSPASAVGWVLGLFLLPYVVLPLYALVWPAQAAAWRGCTVVCRAGRRGLVAQVGSGAGQRCR